MSIPASTNPNNNMSKLDIASLIVNLINVAVCVHVALSALDHNPVPFYYFYIISIGLILNAAYAFVTPSSSK